MINEAGELTKKRIRTTLLLSCGISLILACAAFIIYRVFPFGNRSLLEMDLWSQYYPMMQAGSGGLWSWEGALGINKLAQTAYYTSSPLLSLISLLPASLGLYALDLIVLIRIPLAALTFSIFAVRKFKKADLTTVAFSCAYSLSSYMLAYMTQTMWIDALVLLPLIILGLENMLSGKRPYLYLITLFSAIVCNFYIGYMLCLFSILWFFAFVFSEKIKFRDFLKQLGKFALWSLLAVFAAAALLIPTFLALTITKASDIGLRNGIVINSIVDIISRFTAGADLVFRSKGIANLYCSVIGALSAIIFFFTKKIPVRKRIVFGIFSLIMLASITVNLLDFIWHGFHIPNQLPARYSFMFCFLILAMGCEALSKQDGEKKLPVIIPSLLALAAVMICGLCHTEALSGIIVSAVIIVIFCVTLLLKKKIPPRAVCLIISGVMICEIGYNALISSPDRDPFGEIAGYNEIDGDAFDFVEKYSSSPDNFYRIEIDPCCTFDTPQRFGYDGITYYSSTMSAAAYDFLTSVGGTEYAYNVSNIYSSTPVLNALYSVKYVLSRRGDAAGVFDKVDEYSAGAVLENKYTLPLMYTADPAAADYSPSGQPCLQEQNILYSALSGCNNVYTEIGGTFKYKNATIVPSNDGKVKFENQDTSKTAEFYYSFTILRDNYIIYDSDFTGGEHSVFINGELLYTSDSLASIYRNGSLGYLKEGDVVTVTATDPLKIGYCGFRLYSFNEDEFVKGYENIGTEDIKVVRVGERTINAYSSSDDDSYVVTSIGYDRGWKLYIDGNETEIETIGGYMCAFRLEAGKHIIEMKYTPPGFHTGLYVSAAALVSIAAGAYVYEVKCVNEKRRKRSA